MKKTRINPKMQCDTLIMTGEHFRQTSSELPLSVTVKENWRRNGSSTTIRVQCRHELHAETMNHHRASSSSIMMHIVIVIVIMQHRGASSPSCIITLMHHHRCISNLNILIIMIILIINIMIIISPSCIMRHPSSSSCINIIFCALFFFIRPLHNQHLSHGGPSILNRDGLRVVCAFSFNFACCG